MLEAIISSTIAGSIICTGVLIFKRKILESFGGSVLYYISLATMLFFLLPTSIALPKYTPTAPKSAETAVTHNIAAVPENRTVADENPFSATPAATAAPIETTKIERTANPRQIAIGDIIFAVWAVGLMLSVCRYFISYFRFKKRICGSANAEKSDNIGGINVIRSPLISSPMIFGFFVYTLAVPQTEIDEKNFELALRHEMVHCRRHDSWLKLFAVIVNSICWFNPVAYLMVNLVGEACEYACDEQVTKDMSLADRKDYSLMILSTVCQASPALSSNMAKSKTQLKRRFEMIMTRQKCKKLTRVICAAVAVITAFASVVFANEATPAVSALIKNDYVYVTCFGMGNYNDFSPVEHNGEYFLPLREFMNKSDIDNSKINYDNGRITIDVYLPERSIIGVSEDGNESKTVVPSALVWNTVCTIGSRDVTIANENYTLKNAPYTKDDISYVPYEYLKLLRNCEILQHHGSPYEATTSSFIGITKYGFDSLNNRYYADYGDIHTLPTESKSACYMCTDGDISIKNTGYRTEVKIYIEYADINNPSDKGNAEVTLNRVNRIYSHGNDIEGQFTVKLNGKTLYENEKGYITNLPVPAGEGFANTGGTTVSVGGFDISVHLFGFGNSTWRDYDEKSQRINTLTKTDTTKTIDLYPEAIKLNGEIAYRTSKDNYAMYNTEEKFMVTRMEFDAYRNTNDPFTSYSVSLSNENSDIKVIDENTLSAHFFFARNNLRTDSFDGIFSLLPNNRFELKSNDGRYIVQGRVGEFVPQWLWDDARKNSPVPGVTMINE